MMIKEIITLYNKQYYNLFDDDYDDATNLVA